MSGYQEFPKWMQHPQHRPATVYKQPRYRPGEEGWGKPVDPGQTGTPEKFPNVMVNNKDQEQQYAALGYLPAGVGDPDAYRRAMTNNNPIPESDYKDYPRVLYKRKGDTEKTDTKTVQGKDEEEALKPQGWCRTPGDAVAFKTKKKPVELKSDDSELPPPSKDDEITDEEARRRARISKAAKKKAREKKKAARLAAKLEMKKEAQEENRAA